MRLALSTGGGDCPGLNAALRAVVRHGTLHHGMEVIGIPDGLSGLMRKPFTALPLSLAAVEDIHEVGGTILGTSNRGSPLRDPQTAKQALAMIRRAWVALKIDVLLVVGGDGTHWMARRLVDEGFPIVGIPKTIDNDLMGSDRTIGFATAVEIASEAASRLRTSARAHNRLMALEVMGRDGGHIALATGIAAGADLILIPEIPFDLDAVERHLRTPRAHGRDAYLAVIAEGAHPRGGARVFKKQADQTQQLGGIAAQVAAELTERTGIESRTTVLGHIQRGGPASAADRILAARLAVHAVNLAAAGRTGRLVAEQAGRVVEVPYDQITAARRLVDLTGDEILAARALGIKFGDPSAPAKRKRSR